MRIVHTESSRAIGGQEMRVIEEMEWFARRGHEVALAAAPDSGIAGLARDRNLPLFPVRFRGSFNPLSIARLLQACRQHRAQVMVTHSSRDTFASWPVARWLGIPLLRYQHICIRQRDGWFHRLAWSRAPKCIVAVSRSIKDRLIKQKLATPDRIEVVGEYVDLKAYHPDISPAGVRSRLGIPQEATVIMQIGMIRPDKGQQVLVRAADEILKQHPSCHFVFVGSATKPGYLEELQAEVRSIKNPDRITLAGFQKNLPPLIAASDIICLTSLLEAQSKVIPQAFAMKKLVVASKVGGIPELVRDGENGLLYKKGDPHALAQAIDRALNGDRSALVSNAHALAQELDYDRVMEHTEKLYQALVA